MEELNLREEQIVNRYLLLVVRGRRVQQKDHVSTELQQNNLTSLNGG